jgi:hypothetical protein
MKPRNAVAQISDLLYRGFPTRNAQRFGTLPIGNRRYSRLQTCATYPRPRNALTFQSSPFQMP